jgi:hypothetical protein
LRAAVQLILTFLPEGKDDRRQAVAEAGGGLLFINCRQARYNPFDLGSNEWLRSSCEV